MEFAGQKPITPQAVNHFSPTMRCSIAWASLNVLRAVAPTSVGRRWHSDSIQTLSKRPKPQRSNAGATTLNGALQRMRRTESADELLVRLQRGRGPEAPGPLVLAETERLLTNVLGGRRTVGVTVR